MTVRPPRLEWISLIYLAFFILAILSPQIVRHGVFGFSEERVEEFLIFCFGLAGLGTFVIYEHAMERKDHERDEAIGDRDRVKKELVSSYEYIGAVNRRMEALKALANETAVQLVEGDRLSKEIFQSIAASAATIAKAESGAIRIVALDLMRTRKEFLVDRDTPVRVANRDLLKIHEEGISHAVIDSEDDGTHILVIPSSRRDMAEKAFLLLSMPSETASVDIGLLNVYANQAEVLYRVLVQKNGNGNGNGNGNDMERLEASTG